MDRYLRAFSNEIYSRFRMTADEVHGEIRSHDGLAERIHKDFFESRDELSGWTKIAETGYSHQRDRVIAP